MVNKLDMLFSTDSGRKIYGKASDTVIKYAGGDFYKNGVLVGLSGGADSVMLLLFLAKKRRTEGDFPLLAVHVNHMIRGDEADRDEEFSRRLCDELGVDFISVKIDVPALAKGKGIGFELAAREARYSCFDRMIKEKGNIQSIAVAHNATDNIETVIFNLLRGSGLRGACGIAPVRDNIVRPLIGVSKCDIISALDAVGVDYVTDSTNLSSEYTRNYIRNEILPHLSHLSPDPEAQFTRASEIMRSDLDYLTLVSAEFIEKNGLNPSAIELRALHPAILSRVITAMCERAGLFGVEYTHIKSIEGLLCKENFSVSLPSSYVFRAEYGVCGVYKDMTDDGFSRELSIGINEIPELGIAIGISYDKDTVFSTNVYKFSKKVTVKSAIIYGKLIVRSKIDGDCYRYGGNTHKLKKIFNDKKIPPSKRCEIPVLCDDNGIFLVAGFSCRDDKKTPERALTVTFFYNEEAAIYGLYNK